MTTQPTIHSLAKKMAISSLWILALFNNAFRDIHEFLRADFMEWLLETTTNGGPGISNETLISSAIFYQIPLTMIFLTSALGAKASRTANLIISPIFMLGIIAGNYYASVPNDTDDFIFFGAVIIAMLAVIWYAWNWSTDS